MDKVFRHKEVEEKIYELWEENGYFKPKKPHSTTRGKPFVIAMPPPNVTGELHLGHALTATIEDILIRYHRMRGDPTLWIPGVDHAGIATQVVVERELAKEGKTRHDVGREKFLERVWQWVKKYGNKIDEQHKRLGVSADWSRRKFTLDLEYQKAVKEAFNHLKGKDLIYRDNKVINWCSRCGTTLSDLESIYREQRDKLYYLDYGPVQVATTRPETIFADVAVAVPVGKKKAEKAIVPLVNRLVPIIEDDLVDPKFGTGALKITPAHDETDFEIWQKHKDQIKEVVVVVTHQGTLYPQNKYIPSQFWGLPIKKAREKVLEALKQTGELVKEENYKHPVAHCQRCDTVIEPLISEQWFIKMQPLTKPAIDAVKMGKIKIIPKRFEKIYFQWLTTIKDWCISRQLWWGHKIPRSTDVLDTWFSSALWPFAILGWPRETADFKYFYPTTVMETGYDILFFWVARMVMMGLEMTGKIPFKTIYLHGLIRDPQGLKMSKSRGNIINPIFMTEKYGTDALRISLVIGNTPGKDMRLSEAKIAGYRNFTNKIWNMGRFIKINQKLNIKYQKLELKKLLSKAKHKNDKEMVKKTRDLVKAVTKDLESYNFNHAAETLYDFTWHTFADKYIEDVKKRLDDNSFLILNSLFLVLLKLLHPFMPFVTEEIYQRFNFGQSLMIDSWPTD